MYKRQQNIWAPALLLAGTCAAVQHIAACDQFVHQAGHSRLAQLCDFCQPRSGDSDVLVNQLINLPKVPGADKVLRDQCLPSASFSDGRCV